jgi:hypothetical protein
VIFWVWLYKLFWQIPYFSIRSICFQKVRTSMYRSVHECQRVSLPDLYFPKFKSQWPRNVSGVCGHSLAGIEGSNPACGMNLSILWLLCVFM